MIWFVTVCSSVDVQYDYEEEAPVPSAPPAGKVATGTKSNKLGSLLNSRKRGPVALPNRKTSNVSLSCLILMIKI